jgi:hypothetical protein
MERELSTYTKQGLHVTIASDEIWFPVYEIQFGKVSSRIIATIERPHRGVTVWRAYLKGGEEIGQGRIVGPRTALGQIAKALAGMED